MAIPVRRNPTIFPYRGKWRLTYVDSSGRTKTRTAETKQVAYSLLAQLGALAVTGTAINDKLESVSLEFWIRNWMQENSASLRHKSIRTNQYIAEKYVIPCLGHFALADLSPRDVEDFYRYLGAEANLSASTIHRVHAFLNVPLSTAFRYGLITSNPLAVVRKPKRKRTRVVTLTPNQVLKILTVASAGEMVDLLRWKLALQYGLRQGEALALQIDDFDLESGTLSVTKQLQHQGKLGFQLTPPKSEMGVRTLPLDTETLKLCQEIMRGRDCKTVLFTGANGGYLHASTDRKRWQNLLRKSGFQLVPLHIARHTAATQLVRKGVDARTLQLILGHSSASFTLQTYVHPNLMELDNRIFSIGSIETPNSA